MAITTLSVEQALYVNAAPTPAVTRDTMQHKLPLGRRPQSVLCYHDTNLYAELDLLWFLLQTVVGWVRERISDTHKRIHELRWRGWWCNIVFRTNIHPPSHSGFQSAIFSLTQLRLYLSVPLRNVQYQLGVFQLPSSLWRCHQQLLRGRVPWQKPPPSATSTRAYGQRSGQPMPQHRGQKR